jgi:tetratricopeptide (TPR) repeat protein
MKSNRTFLLAIVLIVAPLLVFARSLGNGFVLWDDDRLIERNPLVQQLTARTVAGAFTSYDPELYVPLTIVSFELEHAVAGFWTPLFHATNLLLHIVCVLLLWRVLKRFGFREAAAFFGALLFALHPVNVEAVAWASARKDVLSTAFALGSLLCWLRFRSEEDKRWYWWSVGLLLCSLLSKPTAIVLPFGFLLVDWFQGRVITKSSLRTYVPFFGLSVLFLIIGLFGKARNISSLTLFQTALLAVKSTVVSISQFVWPRFSLLFLEKGPISIANPSFWLSAAVVLLLLSLILRSLRRTRLVAFAFGWFFLLLLPSFSNFSKGAHVYLTSDRYIYLAQVGLLVLLAAGLERFLRWTGKRSVQAFAVGGTMLLLVAAFFTYQRSLLWHDSMTLFRAALAANPESDVLHYNLGLAFQARGAEVAARREYEAALAINPHSPKVHFNLGILAQEDRNTGEALVQYRAAVEDNPLDAEAWNNLGSLLSGRGDLNGAIDAFKKAIAAAPSFVQAHVNLADAYGKKSMYAEGIQEYREAAKYDPSLRDKLRGLGAL